MSQTTKIRPLQPQEHFERDATGSDVWWNELNP